MMIACSLMGVAIMMGLYGWMHVARGERHNSTQAELDMNVRTAIERIRAETRLSAIEKMVYHPEGAGPYDAISFPVAFARDDQGLVPMLSDTNILWDTTVIYHVDNESPNRLLRTTFSPRHNDMTIEQRKAQLAGVVAAGHGEGLEGVGETAATRTIFANFFSWSITPVAGVFDTYSERHGTKRINFGTVALGPGNHLYTFASRGKNSSSSGRKLGLDTLRVSSGACDLEAEELSLAECSPSPVRQPGFVYSGKNSLLADPGDSESVSVSLSIPNDRWVETNFRAYGSGAENVETAIDPVAHDMVVQLCGTGLAWQAAQQTGSARQVDATPCTNRAFRVLIQGSDAGWVRHNGRLIKHPSGVTPYSGVRLELPAGAIVGEFATIAVAAPTSLSSLSGLAGTFRALRMTRESPTSALAELADGAPMNIDQTNNYVVSFWLRASASGIRFENVRDPSVRMTAMVADCAESQSLALLGTPDWSALPGLTQTADVQFAR